MSADPHSIYPEPFFDVAQICLNGHVINPSHGKILKLSKDFCDRCGDPTITDCPTCKKNIQGSYHFAGEHSPGRAHNLYVRPHFCQWCGNQFPWTERAKQSALELFLEGSEEKVTSEDENQFEQALNDMAKNNSHTPVAVVRFRKLLIKAGKETGSAIKDIVVDIVGDVAKKALFGE